MAKTVLIVEDNELNMRLFNDLLQASGYDTLQAVAGLEAIPLAEEHRPDLILMDIRLPDISGLEVTKMLKARDDLRQIPVIAITASHLKGDEQRYRDQGCDGFIAKPISVPLFLETIEQFLNDDENEGAGRALA